MSGWGRQVSLALTGTAAVVAASATVTGSGTAFLTEVSAGNTLYIDDVEYLVQSVTSNTVLVLSVPYAGINASGLTLKVAQKPKADKTIPPAEIFGVDATEVAMTPGVSAPGWVRVKEFGTRKQYETLVAMRTPPVEDDTIDAEVFPNTTTTTSTSTTTTAAPTTTTTTTAAPTTTSTTAAPTTTTTTSA